MRTAEELKEAIAQNDRDLNGLKADFNAALFKEYNKQSAAIYQAYNADKLTEKEFAAKLLDITKTLHEETYLITYGL